MQRWVMPVELSRDWLQQLLADCATRQIRSRFEVELFAYGHLPLAYSARCFTARAENKPKDQCELACLAYPQGRVAESQEGEAVFVLNGIQTQSGYCYNLIRDLPSMAGLVDVLRLSPQGDETWSWLAQFDQARAGQSATISLQILANAMAIGTASRVWPSMPNDAASTTKNGPWVPFLCNQSTDFEWCQAHIVASSSASFGSSNNSSSIA